MRLRRYRGRHLIHRPLPLAGPAAAGTATAVLAVAPSASAGTHRIEPGETLSGIASRYGTSITRLVRMNDLSDPNHIVAGTRLRVPGATRPTVVYKVKPGDNLSSVAARYGVSIRRIVKANKIVDPNLIVIGDRLRVPGTRRGSGEASLPKVGASKVETMLEQEASSEGVDGSLVKAVAWQESGWKQNVISSAGAIGVMQVMPATADYVNAVLGGENLNVRATRDNIRLGVRYLHHVMDQMPTVSKGLAAYYSGPGNVKRKLKKYQRVYVRSVKALRSRF